MENEGPNPEIEDFLEEGEIYVPLERPIIEKPVCVNNTIINPLDDYLDSPESCSESETDSDSDNRFRAKKPKVKKPIKPLQKLEPKPKSFNIWANVQEDALTETLGGCGVSQDTFDKSRNVESYDYRIATKNKRDYRKFDSGTSYQRNYRRFSTESADGNSIRKLSSDGDSNDGFSRQRSFSDCKRNEKSFRRNANKRKMKDRSNIHLRLGRRPSTNDENSSDGKYEPKDIKDLSITVEDTEGDVAVDIASKLHEYKDNLILRAVKAIGKEKAIELFYETQKIESDGGMVIMNGRRRRTPGGVYIFLIKHDDTITKEQQDEIFLEDKRFANKKKKKFEQKKRKERLKNFREQMRADKDLPTLLSRPEATAQLLSASNKRKTELDRNSENIVTNPPPSPVTDGGRENSSDMDTHQMSEKAEKATDSMASEPKLTNIEEDNDSDYLDLSYGDAMDLF